VNPMTIRTCHQWIGQLASQSSAIAAMQLDLRIKNADLDTDAFNLANDPPHTNLIVRAAESLRTSEASSAQDTLTLLTDIICRDTYGKFCELAAYDWLMRCQLKITTQIKLAPSDILGANDAIIDGLVDHCGFYFDIKAFGFHGHLAKRLKERLESELPGEHIFLEESWDLSIDLFSQLIKDARNIARELKTKRFKKIGPLHIQAKAPEPVNVSGRIVSPYLLAKENATYPFRSANQFTRNAPFILIFVIHPWFNDSAIFNNFGGGDIAFARAFTRRAFMQFTHDSQPLRTVCNEVGADITFSDAAKLLSAVIFVNAWPDGHKLDRETMPSAVYLNPRASHPIGYRASLFRSINPNILIEDFVHDDY
jgi:hypothetical protein